TTRSTLPLDRKLSRFSDRASLNVILSSAAPSFLATYLATSTSKPSTPLGPFSPSEGWSYLTPTTIVPALALAASGPAAAGPDVPGLGLLVDAFLLQPVAATAATVETAATAIA